MPSHTKTIGTVGEQVLITEFVKHGIPVFVPVRDNLPIDMIVEIGGRFLRVQVKTTEFASNGKMVFCTNISNPFRKTSRKYDESEIDLFGLYCIENGYIGLLKIGECTAKETVIRLNESKNNQKANIKFACDYAFERQINLL